MSDSMKVTVNPDGTATAAVGNTERTFPDLDSAVRWATALLYDLEGEEFG